MLELARRLLECLSSHMNSMFNVENFEPLLHHVVMGIKNQSSSFCDFALFGLLFSKVSNNHISGREEHTA
jgi:hypothetical protein